VPKEFAMSGGARWWKEDKGYASKRPACKPNQRSTAWTLRLALSRSLLKITDADERTSGAHVSTV
jgi:hypothetical protein